MRPTAQIHVEQGHRCSYTWLRNTLQHAGLVKKAKKRGAASSQATPQTTARSREPSRRSGHPPVLPYPPDGPKPIGKGTNNLNP